MCDGIVGVWLVGLAQIIRDRQGKAYLPGGGADPILRSSYESAITQKAWKLCRSFTASRHESDKASSLSVE
jgi:hypothetical protein